MTVTARIGGEQTGENVSYAWGLEYDDASRRVTAAATGEPGIAAITTAVQLTASAAVTVQFVRAGRPPDDGVDFPVTIGAGPALIGPAIPSGQVNRIVGKPGALGGLAFSETASRG
jgi:hypothetical protein